MQYRIETLKAKKIIGERMTMSLADNKTSELWRSFMSRRKEIKNTIGTDLFSMQLYDPLYFSNFNPHTTFEKWAAVEVFSHEDIPEGMKSYTLPEGMYAVFLYKGAASKGAKAFQYIFGTWFPASGYELDNRPHFELLGEKYKNDHPDSEEEIWIPIKAKE